MSQDDYNYLNCVDCDELTQYEFQCNKNNIFDFKEECNLILYYKSPIKFAGCPFAHYLEMKNIIDFITVKNQNQSFDLSKEPFIRASCIYIFNTDRKVQESGEIQNEIERRKKGVK